MKNNIVNLLKGVLGLLCLGSFVSLLISMTNYTGSDTTEYAVRTGTTMGLSLVLGILLLRSVIKKTGKEIVPAMLFKTAAKTNWLKIKKNWLVVTILLLVSVTLIFVVQSRLASNTIKSTLENKILCERYSMEIEREIKEGNNNIFGIYESLESIFYSPIENSCLYTVHQIFKGRAYIVRDALTKTTIQKFSFPNEWDSYKEFIAARE